MRFVAVDRHREFLGGKKQAAEIVAVWMTLWISNLLPKAQGFLLARAWSSSNNSTHNALSQSGRTRYHPCNKNTSSWGWREEGSKPKSLYKLQNCTLDLLYISASPRSHTTLRNNPHKLETLVAQDRVAHADLVYNLSCTSNPSSHSTLKMTLWHSWNYQVHILHPEYVNNSVQGNETNWIIKYFCIHPLNP
jgi:hypothetical protein